MADDSEQFVSPEYATASWAQRFRYMRAIIQRSVPYMSNLWLWTGYGTKGSGNASPAAVWQDALGDLLGNTTRGSDTSRIGPAPFTPQEVMFAKAMYWILVPLFQYVAAMVLADTFQYFTHRAFHVNKWLYSELTRHPLFLTVS